MTWYEDAITDVGGGRFRTVLAATTGSQVKTSITSFGLDEARRMRDEGRAYRDQGDDVRALFRAERLRRAASTRTHLSPSATIVTVQGAQDKYMEGRREQSAESDHSRSGLGKGSSTVRPRTLDTDEGRGKWLTSTVGALLSVDLSSDTFDKRVLKPMAERGCQPAYQKQVIAHGRRIIRRLPASQRPEDFPWPDLKPRAPKESHRKPPNPLVWGGERFDKAPALPFNEAYAIATKMRAAFRVIIYLIAFMGLRRGEASGLTLGHLHYRDGLLMVRIEQQMDLRTGEILGYVKSDNSYRTLVCPPLLADYIVSYVQRYHGLDIRSRVPQAAAQALLTVTSNGRAPDGGFMPAEPDTWAHEFHRACEASGKDYETLGYELEPHHLRASCGAYMLNAAVILQGMESGPEDHAFSSIMSGVEVSRWLGHLAFVDRNEHNLAADPVTLAFYNPKLAGTAPRVKLAIATFLDRCIAHEIGSLLDEPDRLDSAFVGKATDGWILAEDAARMMGVTTDAVTTRCRKPGSGLSGRLGFMADGDREPPGRRWMVLQSDVEAELERFSELTKSAASIVTGLNWKTLTRLVDSGVLLTVQNPGFDATFRRSALTDLLAAIYTALLRLMNDRALTPNKLRREFIETKHLHAAVGDAFPYSRSPTTVQLSLWLAQLLDEGAIRKTRNGCFTATGEVSAPEAAKRTLSKTAGRRRTGRRSSAPQLPPDHWSRHRKPPQRKRRVPSRGRPDRSTG